MSHQTNKTRLYEALGQIVVSFKALEQALEAIIFCCMEVSPAQVRILMNSMSFATKVETMESLLRELHADDELGKLSITLQEFIERCAYCERQRNEWVRSYWIPELEADAGMVRRLSTQVVSSDSELTLEIIPLTELENFILCLNATVTYLQAFHQKLFVSFERVQGPEHFQRYLRTQLYAGNDAR
jgi:hypothetical protein